MPDRRPDLSLVVPTYNERGHIEDLANQLFAAAERAGLALELVIVDDNSPDGTGAIADQLAASRPVKVIHRAGKLGLGSAVVEGIRIADARVVGVIDADFSHPPALVPRMYAAFVATGADMLVASRYVQGGGTEGWPMGRRVMSRVACWMARPLTPIRDAVSGFFMIRHELAATTVVKADGFKIGLELLVRARPAHLVELPFEFANRKQGKSKMGTRETLKYLVQLRDLYWTHLTGVRPQGRSYRLVSPREVEAFATAGPAGTSK
jgi:dolichol-phosphate mannosyltransferase